MKQGLRIGLLIALLSHFFISSYISAPGEIRGVVFEDYNADGQRTTGEPGISGIIINGYADGDAVGAPSYSTTTGLDGTYALTGLGVGEALRLEYVVPASKSYLAQGAAGNTSVVFAAEGDENVDVGFNNPNNYSIADPTLVTPCYIALEHDAPIGGKRDVLVGIKYSWGRVPTDADKEDRVPLKSIHYAQNEQIGTTYGIAWNRLSGTLYMAAYHKKHSDYGPNGPGAIYQISIDPISGIPLSAPSLFTDVAGFAGISVCGSHGADLNPASDPATADLVGKCSLGDLDISDDNTKLYTVNLGDRKIIEIDIATGNMTNSWQFPTTLSGTGCYACAHVDDVRPFGLKYRNGLLYVGATCTGENTQNNSDIAAFIYKIDPSLGAAATVDEFFCYNWGIDLPTNGRDRYWRPASEQEAGGIPSRGGKQNYLFSDIEFYGNDLIMGFRDRGGDMLGENVPGVSDGSGFGEIVTAFFNTTTGDYELESIVGANVSAGPDRPGSPSIYGEGVGDEEEFYWGDGGNFHGNSPYGVTGGATHEDQCFGGLAQINTQDVVMTGQNMRQPFGVGQTGSGSIGWLNNVTGEPVKSFKLYDGGDLGEPGSLFAKANGLGDLEGLTTPAPIEIGDYVWVDSDGDGVQDPNEAAIAGVTVELFKGSSLVATTTTDGNGRYYFTSAENPVTNGSLVMDPVDTDQSTFNAGDPETNNFAHELNNGDMAVGADWRLNADRAWGALRFPDLSIPQGATITNAYIQFHTDNANLPQSDPAEVRFYAENEDNITEYMNVDDGLTNRNKTTSFVDWTIPAFIVEDIATPNERSPDLSSVIQEVINRTGWVSGNALGIFVEYGLNGSTGTRRLQNQPRLIVGWTTTTGVTGTNAGDVLPEMNYEVRLNLSQSAITTPSYNLTSINSTDAGLETGNDPGTDIRDSDGSEVSGNAVIAFTTGKWGENNHGLDFGFNSGPVCTLTVTCSKTDQTNCTPLNGSVTATASGGQGNLTYAWVDASNNPVGSTATVNNLGAGTYTVTVTDDILTGCTATCNVTILDNTVTPTATCSATTNTNCGSPNGTASIATNAASPTYLWSNGATAASLSNLSNGTYTVTVTDGVTGCTNTCDVVVGSTTTLPTATCSATDNTNCATPNGTASVATNASSPTYLWSNSATTASISNLSAGTYTVTVTDGVTGCTNTCDAVVGTTVTPPTATCSATNNTNCGSPNGTASVTTNAASPTYLWNNGATTASLSNLSNGTYTVTITDGVTGCTNTCDAIVGSTVILPTANCTAMDNTNCASPNGTASVTTNASSPTYLWSNGSTAASLTGLSNGTYTVTVTDGVTGCTNTCDAIVGSTTILPTVNCASTDNTNCASPNGTASVTTNASSPTYLWSTGSTMASLTGLSAGTYTVTVTDGVTACTNTCSLTLSDPVGFSCSLSVNSQPICSDLNGGSITATVIGGNSPFTFMWSDGQTLQTASNLSGGTYSLTVTDTENCTTSCSVSINTPSGCCALAAANLTMESCNDNGTVTNPADDYITFSLNPTGTSISASYTVTVDNGGVVSLIDGSPATGVSYGNSSEFRLQAGSADGTTNYTITVTDDTDGTCQVTTTVMQPPCAVTLYSLGNQVFYDDDNSGTRELGENGVNGIILQLLNADGSVYDSDPVAGGTQVLSVSTANGGYYRFDDLPAGSYIVEILSSAFSSGGILENYSSSDGVGEEVNPNADGDENDNGLDNSPSGTIRSGVVTLGGTEPLGESEPGFYTTGSFTGTPASDSESNLTVDFGFYRQRDRPDCCDPLRPPCPEEPCHFVSNSIYFGGSVTNDPSTNTNSAADTDLDDGLLWGENVHAAPGGSLNLPIEIYNATGADAYFRMWIDWNGDGDFEDGGEQVADELYLAVIYSGTYRVYHQVNIPVNAAQNQNLALRMRLSTDDTNTASPCGTGACANDGEIEDYFLRVSCPTEKCTVPGVSLMRN